MPVSSICQKSLCEFGTAFVGILNKWSTRREIQLRGRRMSQKQPVMLPIKDGWAAIGDGWAVHGVSQEEARRRFEDALQRNRTIEARPDATDSPKKS